MGPALGGGQKCSRGAPYQGLINSGRLGASESVPNPGGSTHPSARQEQPALAAHLLRLPVPAAHRLQHAQTHLQDALQGGRPGEWSRAQVRAQAQPLPFPPGLSCRSPKGYRLWLRLWVRPAGFESWLSSSGFLRPTILPVKLPLPACFLICEMREQSLSQGRWGVR